MGVYPLLPDETCLFLAADFDKKTWQQDVAAFCETCDLHDVPAAVERSRSGDGAHVWLFFTMPAPAAAARKLGCFLMPRGGFGNLIALPLQRRARDAGNSVFVDSAFVPWPDQWAFLAGVGRMEPASVQALADEA